MRVIDADKLLKDGIRVEYGYNDNGLILVPMRDVRKSIENAPTVDVVSRSEYERVKAVLDNTIKTYADCMKAYGKEIFADIKRALNGTNILYSSDLADLEKKYMEDGHEISFD